MDFKLDYPRFSRCFGKSLEQETVETMNISPIATYANYTHCSRVSCRRDETTKCLNWFLLDSFKANNCFLPEGKKFSASLQKLFLPVSKPFLFLTMRYRNVCFEVSLVRFTLRQVGSFVQNYPFARNAWVHFRWGYNRKQVCFKIQNVTVGKDVSN